MTYEIVADGKAIKCLVCGMTSYHQADIQHRYCGWCHQFHDEMRQARLSWSEIAASAYRAYVASHEGQIDMVGVLPGWDNLSRPVQVAWEAAARQVEKCLMYNEDRRLKAFGLDEEQWREWKPKGSEHH